LPAAGTWTVTESVGSTTISGTGTTGSFSNLAAGTYTFTVTDGTTTCTSVASGNAVINVQPVPPAAATVTTTQPTCAVVTGTVVVSAPLGATLQYNIDGGAYQASVTFAGVATGAHTILVRSTTDNTCISVPKVVNINAIPIPPTVTSTQVNVKCFGGTTGSATAIPAGGTGPYTYSWNTTPVQTTATATGLGIGTYTVTVKDANLCTATTSVTITQPAAALNGSTLVTNVLCSGGNNGAINLTVTGGTAPYTFLWSNSAITEDLNNLVPGSYTVKVTDANGCFINSTAQVTEPAKLAVQEVHTDATCPGDLDGSITLTITGGTSPYKIIWSDGSNALTRAATDTTYSVVVTDANSCAASLDVQVGFSNSSQCIFIPQVITPNGDGKNDTWIIKNIDLYPNAEVLVYNRWGQLVFQSKNVLANPWDGRSGGKLVPVDSYHYILDLHDGSKPRSGVISVIR
jgi:gliding motility-associated-like protein